jgi:hypothetical protein
MVDHFQNHLSVKEHLQQKGDVAKSDDGPSKDKIQDQNGINNPELLPELSSISSTATESERLQEIVSSSAGDRHK